MKRYATEKKEFVAKEFTRYSKAVLTYITQFSNYVFNNILTYVQDAT